MPATVTPIRYPGGKTKLYSLVRGILEANDLLNGTYVEPFAGGAGLALKLLSRNDVKRVIINDADPAVFSVWNGIVHHPEEMCGFIEKVDITIDEWKHQREIYNRTNREPSIELAKATFFLNRTNISGVITGGVIGGLEQKGKYKINARFTRDTLIKKIKSISEKKNIISIYNLDVMDFIRDVFPNIEERSLINFDPPYVNKGSQLYKNAFTDEDHKKLRDEIVECDKKWIVTYDICDLTEKLYDGFDSDYINVYYSANGTRKAREVLFHSHGLIIPKKVQTNG